METVPTINSMIINTKTTPKIPPSTDIDIDILEYLYVCPLNDILADPSLVALVLSNGYYKAAVCDGSNLECLDITFNGVKHTLHKSPGKYNILQIVDPKIKHTPILMGTSISNNELKL
jgi:hypothetical protein